MLRPFIRSDDPPPTFQIDIQTLAQLLRINSQRVGGGEMVAVVVHRTRAAGGARLQLLTELRQLSVSTATILRRYSFSCPQR